MEHADAEGRNRCYLALHAAPRLDKLEESLEHHHVLFEELVNVLVPESGRLVHGRPLELTGEYLLGIVVEIGLGLNIEAHLSQHDCSQPSGPQTAFCCKGMHTHS
jgi:hypothetical protein